MRNHCYKTLALLLGLAALLGGVRPACAQRVVTVVPWTGHNWRFNAAGTELGTVWRTNNYVDTGWAGSGTGLFGVETSNPFPYTPLFPAITTPTANVATNLYLRTYFTYYASNLVSGLTLYATNFADDGAAVYLNGLEAGRIRFTATANTAAAYATGGPATEGQFDVLTIATNLLRVGSNTLAVEVHQNAAGSSDIVWGHTLVAIVPTMLSITNQPDSQTNAQGSAAVFTVGVSGGPVTTYTWQKETSPGSGIWGAPVPASPNSPTYNIPNLNLTHAGNYRVIAQGSVNSVTSAPAALVIIADSEGPVMLSAQPATLSGVTNRILIRWNELLNSSSASMTNNYVVRMFPQTNIVLPVSSVVYNASNSILNIVTTTNWYVSISNYYITVSNVRDTFGNNVAPNSQIPLAWPSVTNVIPVNTAWDYHVSYSFEDVSTNNPPWYATNFVESFNWGGPAFPVFGYDPIDPLLVTCIGTENTRVQPEGTRPTYFRSTFNWPYPLTVADVRVRAVYDDGMVLFLNGSEILRLNVAAGALTGNTTAPANVTDADCRTNVVTGVTIRPGLNYLAAGVYQNTTGGNEFGDLTFALEMDTVSFLPGGLPTNPPPRINLVRQGTNMITSWSGYGWALEILTDTRTAKRGPGMTNYYIGDWTEAQPMSNPQTNSFATSGARIFRLRKAQLH